MENQENLGLQMGSVPLGTVVAFALETKNIPKGWLLCDGKTIPATHPLSNFMNNTPNLCGRTLIGTGAPPFPAPIQNDGRYPNFDQTNNWPLGYTGGEYKHVMTVDEMPGHNHGLYYPNQMSYDQGYPQNGFLAVYATDRNSGYSGQQAMLNTGNNQPQNNMQPYYAINYIIYAG